MTAQLTTTGRIRLKTVTVERLRLVTTLVLPDVLRYERRTQTGSLSLTGTQPVRLFFLTPATGSAITTGRAGNILLDGIRTPDQDDLAITGYKPTLRNKPNVYLTPGTGSFGVAGRGGVIDIDGERVPDSPELILTGYEPVRFAGEGRAPATAALTIAGTTPAVGLTITPSVGALTTTGIAPSALRLDHNNVPNSGALALTGVGGVVIGGATLITPSTGAANVTGTTPSIFQPGDSVTFDGTNDWLSLELAFSFAATISTHTVAYNLRTAALAAGWGGTSPLNATITINSAVYVYSTGTATAAFSSGSMPVGSTLALTNNGYIMGKGGNGGTSSTTAAQNGGDAMDLDADLVTTITNGSGYILGGGGGGGSYKATSPDLQYSGGGGGAGGGVGGNSYDLVNSPQAGGAGGGVGASGSNGSFVNAGDALAGGGGGGGRVFNGAGGAGGHVGEDGPALQSGRGAGGGGGGGAQTEYVEDDGYAGAGGGPGVAGGTGSFGPVPPAFGGMPSWGGGGGGWGAAGGAGGGDGGSPYAPGSAGKAIELNSGSSPTFISGNFSPNLLGAVS